MANPSKQAIKFFYDNAGWRGGQKERRANARALAEAEEEAEERGWEVRWEEDPEGWDTLGDIPEEDVKEILTAVLYDEEGEVIDSLGGVVNPDRRYGRVVEAELALEALSGGYASNASRGALDTEAVRELELYIDNDQRYAPGSPRGMGRSIVLNLLRKMKKGRYDSKMAVKAWKNLADEAAKGYAKEFDDARRWADIFSVPTREAVAVGLRDQFEEDAEAGEYAHVDTRIGR